MAEHSLAHRKSHDASPRLLYGRSFSIDDIDGL